MPANTHRISLGLSLLLALGAFACSPAKNSSTDAGSTDAGPTDAGDTDAGPVSSDIEVLGVWTDNYASDDLLTDEDIMINDTVWNEDTVVSYDNTTRSAITQTYHSDMFDPDSFNKIVWTAPAAGSFWYCEIVYGEATYEGAASSTAVADATDPATGGCAGFSWTQMMPHTPTLDVIGSWTDGSGYPVDIDSVSWGGYPIIWYGLAASGPLEWAITKSPAPAGAAPEASNVATYNRVVWLAPSSGSFYGCIEATGVATAEAAQSMTDTVDTSSPSTGGCNGSAWTQLTQGASPGAAVPDIGVLGVWTDNYASDDLLNDEDIMINDTVWNEDTVVSYDNTTRTAITQTYHSDMFDPDTFNKIVWTAPAAGSFWYCEIVYEQATYEAAASSTTVADATDPSTGGCAGFSWTEMMPFTPALDVIGSWTDGSGYPVDIGSVSWGGYPIIWNGQVASGPLEWAITKNPAPVGSAPEASNVATYNRVVWLPPSSGSFYACIEDTGVATAEAAQSMTDTVDTSSPSTGGCNGSAWLQLTQVVSGG